MAKVTNLINNNKQMW